MKHKHNINLGLGVQSTTLFRMACLGLIEPRPKCAVFADPGSERTRSYDMLGHLQEFGDIWGIPVYVLSAGNLFEDLIRRDGPAPPLFVKKADGTKGMFPRQCTSNYKIAPIKSFLRQHLGATSKNPVTSWIGISIDEATRMKKAKEKYQILRYPLIEMRMSRVDCYKWLAKNNFPIPVSSACLGCPYLRDTDYAKYSDEEIEYVANWEDRLHEVYKGKKDKLANAFVHKSLKPFRDRPFMDSVNENQISLQLEVEDKDSLCDEGGCFL